MHNWLNKIKAKSKKLGKILEKQDNTVKEIDDIFKKSNALEDIENKEFHQFYKKFSTLVFGCSFTDNVEHPFNVYYDDSNTIRCIDLFVTKKVVKKATKLRKNMKLIYIDFFDLLTLLKAEKVDSIYLYSSINPKNKNLFKFMKFILNDFLFMESYSKFMSNVFEKSERNRAIFENQEANCLYFERKYEETKGFTSFKYIDLLKCIDILDNLVFATPIWKKPHDEDSVPTFDLTDHVNQMMFFVSKTALDDFLENENKFDIIYVNFDYILNKINILNHESIALFFSYSDEKGHNGFFSPTSTINTLQNMRTNIDIINNSEKYISKFENQKKHVETLKKLYAETNGFSKYTFDQIQMSSETLASITCCAVLLDDFFWIDIDEDSNARVMLIFTNPKDRDEFKAKNKHAKFTYFSFYDALTLTKNLSLDFAEYRLSKKPYIVLPFKLENLQNFKSTLLYDNVRPNTTFIGGIPSENYQNAISIFSKYFDDKKNVKNVWLYNIVELTSKNDLHSKGDNSYNVFIVDTKEEDFLEIKMYLQNLIKKTNKKNILVIHKDSNLSKNILNSNIKPVYTLY